ncbi:MAG: ATP-dependent endonuclease [Prolixibacteraceae bacterium]
MHLKYIWVDRGKQKYFKREVWGGDNENQQIPYEALQEIFFTYLDPLRDAVNALKPYSYNNKTAQLFNELTSFKKGDDTETLNSEIKQKMASDLYSVFEDTQKNWSHILRYANDKVNTHLKGTGISNKYPEIKMNYKGRKYSDVIRGVELKRPVFKEPKGEQEYFEIFQNGLGENNLIYTSVVLGDLLNRCEDADLQIYNALLVEEPEAHLHPQFQNTFFNYLNKLKDSGLQIFITSHSPTITAKSSFQNITILQRKKDRFHPFSFSQLDENDFSTKNRKHLRKFLDTTKSQLFFANGVILVEGIAEAILLPVLSKYCLDVPVDLDKEGIEIVNVGGVAFEHFAKLFNNKSAEKRLKSKCTLITDSDPKNGVISARAKKAQGLNGKNLKVVLSANTLEHDLFENSEDNKKIMQIIYRFLHKGSAKLKGDFDAGTLMKKLKSNQDKGEFALELRDILGRDSKNEEIDLKKMKFKVPQYISDAISWVTEK